MLTFLAPANAIWLHEGQRRDVARAAKLFLAAAAGLLIEVGDFQYIAPGPRRRQCDPALVVGHKRFFPLGRTDDRELGFGQRRGEK